MQLQEVIKKRHSTRAFSNDPIPPDLIAKILLDVDNAPSSCDRKAVYSRPVSFRDNKSILGGLLVGGVGWIHRADVIFLILAKREAYRENLDYMPYLDAGFYANTMWLSATDHGVKAAYVNPNIRGEFQLFFGEQFLRPGEIFCGAIALGMPE